jgi:hypothetical protein
MISDILSRTVGELDHYLSDPIWDETYAGEIRERLIRLRDEADNLRSVLDAPPAVIPAADDHPDQTDPVCGGWIDRMMAEESAVEPPFFSQSDLHKRGWSKRLIAEVLGEPDWMATNPHVPGAARMLCWRQYRVLVAEDTAEFKLHRSRQSKSVDTRAG